jgi:hypothetical protein
VSVIQAVEPGANARRLGEVEVVEYGDRALPGGPGGRGVPCRVMAVAEVDEDIAQAVRGADLLAQVERALKAARRRCMIAEAAMRVREAVPRRGLAVRSPSSWCNWRAR